MSKEKQVGVVAVEKKKLYYRFVLDRSGSMSGVREETVNNINEQINVMKDVEAQTDVEIFLTVLLFDERGTSSDDWFSYLYINKPIKEVQPITLDQYIPHGGTPLRDAIGKSVTDLQTELGDSLGHENVKVLITVYTDGQENASKTYSPKQIKSMVEHLSADGKFVFTFVGAGTLDAVTKVSKDLGVNASNTMAYKNDKQGHGLASKSINRSFMSFTSAYSSGADVKADYFAAAEADK